jgi:hypothetical protein
VSWQDRIGQLKYTAPSGNEFFGAFENLSKFVDKKTTAFEFPDAGGTWVQDLGKTGRRIPMRFMFWGHDYDLRADAVDALLGETGIGVLEHPLYGTMDVVVFGRIERHDEIKTRGNQVTFSVTFFETVRVAFPLKVNSSEDDFNSAWAAFEADQAETFANALDLDTTLENVSLRDRYQLTKDAVKRALQGVADVQAAIQKEFDRVNESIDDATSVFIDDPIALAYQTAKLISTPASSSARIAVKLTSYTGALRALTSAGARYVPANDSVPDNAFHSDDMLASNLLASAALATITADFQTRGEALSASDVLQTAFDDYTTWRDGNIASLVEADSGALYKLVLDVVAAVARFLLDASFSLKQERSVILTAPTTPVNLEARYYKTAGENLDFVISSNGFVGSEILIVPAGRSVVYYT